MLSVAAVVDLLREVAAEHPDLTDSNVYLKAKGFSTVQYNRCIRGTDRV